MILSTILAVTAASIASGSPADTDMQSLLNSYQADLGSISRFYDVGTSPTRLAKMREFDRDYLGKLAKVKFDGLDEDGRVDYILFKNLLERDARQLELHEKARKESEPLVTFASRIVDPVEAKQRMEPVDAEKSAANLKSLKDDVAAIRKKVEGGFKADKTVAYRAARTVDRLRGHLDEWFRFYNDYDPIFTWWCATPFKEADTALGDYANFLREKLVGIKPGDKDAIVGDPIGRDGLISELKAEMIPYTPEELIEIANKEFAWCEVEMKKASNALGYGDDWKKALEHVKTLHVGPGEQPQLIRKLALEAIKFVDDHDLVTVPPLCRETWRMSMMSADRQRINPFFLGGEEIQVSYPTAEMTQEEKLMSMRGNNVHFARATVFHELIPGHHLQGFMTDRYKPYRGLFGTPFWIEGWALYWEMTFWDLGFPATPENKIGMLFWRMHRCARIIFSLNFHLGKMTPQQCIDFLVDRVGHERATAEGEVRRSFTGDYSPLYQAAYMLGAFQFRALHKELVESGKMTNRQFHDAILHENDIPVEMVRALLTKQRLSKEFESSWRFYERR